MKNDLHLSISPCPNDIYIFYALLNNRIDISPYRIKYTLADIQELNEIALRGEADIVKISVAAYPYIKQDYSLLPSGGALGWGCGPVLVARDPKLPNFEHARVAIPGKLTTAALLFSKYALSCSYQLVEMRYDRIMPAVAEGQVDAGVVIHEGRMTYQKYSLEKVVDLGQWWEEETGLPIPLGIIAIRKELGMEIKAWMAEKIRQSIEYLQEHPNEADSFIREKAQELDPETIKKHIENFVTDYSFDMGQTGIRAIEELI